MENGGKTGLCPFCDIKRDIIFQNKYALVIEDAFPVSKGHLLVITRRHVASFRDTTEKEKQFLFDLVDRSIDHLNSKYSPQGFNIGINIGEDAGQSVPHVHIHVIPRYKGDVPEPKGGVRCVIPWKQTY